MKYEALYGLKPYKRSINGLHYYHHLEPVNYNWGWRGKNPQRTGKLCKRGGTRGPRTEEGGSEGAHTSSQSSFPGEEEAEPDPPDSHRYPVLRFALEPARLLALRVSPSCRRNGPRCQPYGREGEISHPGDCSSRCRVLSLLLRGPRLGAVRPACAPLQRREGSRARHPGGLDQRRGAGGRGNACKPAPSTFGLCSLPAPCRTWQDLWGGAEGQWARALPAPQPFPDTTPFRGNASGCG